MVCCRCWLYAGVMLTVYCPVLRRLYLHWKVLTPWSCLVTYLWPIKASWQSMLLLLIQLPLAPHNRFSIQTHPVQSPFFAMLCFSFFVCLTDWNAHTAWSCVPSRSGLNFPGPTLHWWWNMSMMPNILPGNTYVTDKAYATWDYRWHQRKGPRPNSCRNDLLVLQFQLCFSFLRNQTSTTYSNICIASHALQISCTWHQL